MSMVPYTVNVKEFICEILEDMRKSTETLDFSRMKAQIENIQYHATRMEKGLDRNYRVTEVIKDCSKDEEVSDEEFRKKIIAAFEQDIINPW